jgi:hypothetical protein
MQYEKDPNQALNCNIFRIPFPSLPNRLHQAHHGHNGFEIRSFAAVVSVVAGPGPEFTNVASHLIMGASIGAITVRACDKRKGG